MKTCPLITTVVQSSHSMSLAKNISRGIRESHMKREMSIEKAAREANYLFRAVISNQHFFNTVSVPFILLSVQTQPQPINTMLWLHLIVSWTVSQTQRYREWFAWIGYDKECLCAGALHINVGLVPGRDSVNINMESHINIALMEPLKSLQDNIHLRWHCGVQKTFKTHATHVFYTVVRGCENNSVTRSVLCYCNVK